ncbi:MAG: NAD-binding protein [Xanthomonadales bacterium]|jgi:Trk K+ transport system NAD-binding subunit|nr:NAD-binding protein [Xanthomonadales bacterium]
MNDIVWLTMRRLRTPLIVLLLTYFISVCIVVAVPGVDGDGNPVRLSFLDAAYFIAILSTTIGLGEVPYVFTELQRLVVFFLIFPNVVAWLYSFTAIIGLFLDDQFKAMQAHNRFVREVQWLGRPRSLWDRILQRESPKEGLPFYLVCGMGATGSMLAEGLLDRGLHVVAIDRDAALLTRLGIDARFARVPMLAGSVSDADILRVSGLDPRYRSCRGVIAVTDTDQANLTVAITSKLLRPDLPVFARSHQQRVCDNLASFGTDAVVNPYQIFAKRLALAFRSPIRYLVQDWLLSVPGSKLRTRLNLKNGRWVVCGAGRFGQPLIEVLEAAGQSVTVVDVDPDRVAQYEHAVEGRGTEAATLEQAGIREAAGVIAGTGDDVDNLSIILTALELNGKLCTIARQEDPKNAALFAASGTQLVAQPNLIVTRRILALATTPLLKAFLDHLEREDDAFGERVESLLRRRLGGRAPNVWVTELVGPNARGLTAAREEGVELRLRHLVHNTRTALGEDLRCVCLVLERGDLRLVLPNEEEKLQPGDKLLFAGRGQARREISRALQDPVLLLDFATPEQRIPRTAIGRWLARRGS